MRSILWDFNIPFESFLPDFWNPFVVVIVRQRMAEGHHSLTADNHGKANFGLFLFPMQQSNFINRD